MTTLCALKPYFYSNERSTGARSVSPTPTLPKSREDEWSDEVRSEFVSGGLSYFYTKSLARLEQWWSGLKSSPTVLLQKPVIFVSGFQAPRAQFDTILGHLTSNGFNGGAPVFIKDGSFYSDEEATLPISPPSEAKVFKLVTGSVDTPVQIAEALESADAALEQHYGCESVDIVAHSLGGLGARLFCDRGNRAGRLCLVGTPNQGSRAALLTKAALKNDIGWAATMAHVGPASVAALEWMVPVANGNPKLDDLNGRWRTQVENTEGMLIIASSGLQSPHSYDVDGPGDGLIELESTAVGEVKRHVLEGQGRKNHFTQVNDPEVFDRMREFFGWKEAALPLEAESAEKSNFR